MKTIHFLLFFTISIISINCSSFYDNQNYVKPNSSGKSGEVLVVISDNLWNGVIGDTIFYSLAEPFGVLPQDEPIFEVIQLPKDAFNSFFKTHRNIIFINIGKENLEPKISKTTNQWANSQLIYNFYAPSDSSFLKLWQKYAPEIKKTFFQEELKRYNAAYKNYQNDIAKKEIAEKYFLTIDLASDYQIDIKKEDFCWISRETDISSQGIFIYTYPYTDENTFTLDYIVEKRNQFTKQNVPGPEKNTYMQTEVRVPMITEEITIDGNYGFLVRGLWYTENYFLGGPFVSITTLDEKRNRIITIEAYVYAGKQNKKLYLWQTESIIKTLKIIE